MVPGVFVQLRIDAFLWWLLFQNVRAKNRHTHNSIQGDATLLHKCCINSLARPVSAPGASAPGARQRLETALGNQEPGVDGVDGVDDVMEMWYAKKETVENVEKVERMCTWHYVTECDCRSLAGRPEGHSATQHEWYSHTFAISRSFVQLSHTHRIPIGHVTCAGLRRYSTDVQQAADQGLRELWSEPSLHNYLQIFKVLNQPK